MTDRDTASEVRANINADPIRRARVDAYKEAILASRDTASVAQLIEGFLRDWFTTEFAAMHGINARADLTEIADAARRDEREKSRRGLFVLDERLERAEQARAQSDDAVKRLYEAARSLLDNGNYLRHTARDQRLLRAALDATRAAYDAAKGKP